VRPDGGIVAQSGGITLAAKPTPGRYILNFGSAVTGKLILVSNGRAGPDTSFRGTPTAGPCGGGTEGSTCAASDNANHVFVYTSAPDNIVAEDHSFYVAVIG
jgi:hypothetical protein